VRGADPDGVPDTIDKTVTPIFPGTFHGRGLFREDEDMISNGKPGSLGTIGGQAVHWSDPKAGVRQVS
jgi:hypothetical protein